MEDKRYWVWFSLIKDLGARRKMKLLKKFKNPKNIFNLNEEELLECEVIDSKILDNILDKNTREQVDSHLEYMIKNGIDIINFYDEEYPKILKKIYDPPISLYVKGNKNILNNFMIAIVGCRNSSLYGEKIAKKFAFELSKKNIVVVSRISKRN